MNKLYVNHKIVLKKNFLFVVVLFFSGTSFAQEILWADKILGVSSEKVDMYFSPQNRAIQLLGKPNVLPNDGIQTPCAWKPNGAAYGEDWVMVGFYKSLKVRQVAIFENFNYGGIARVWCIDTDGVEHLILENPEPIKKRETNGRILHIIVPEAAYEVKAIKVLIDHAQAKGEKQIDAIAVSDSETPLIDAQINLVENIPADRTLESLGASVNSIYGELAPIISPDGKELYITREGHPENIKDKGQEGIPRQDIWVSKKQGKDSWSIPVNLGTPLNNTQDNAVACISADGNTLFLLNHYFRDGRMALGLSKSRRINGEWSFPEKVIIDNFQALSHEETAANGIKESKTYTEFSVTPNEKIIVMGLKRSQTFGERDLYVSFRKENGTYTKPVNLGKTINTADSEGSPFISADTKTLYFLSKGHLGYGNGDIFMSKRLDDSWTKWSEPQNLGKPINSERWDGFFNIPVSGDYAYMSINQGKEGQGIFKVRLTPEIQPEPMALVSGQVIDISTKKPIAAQITLQPILIKNADSSRIDSLKNESILADYDPKTGEYKMVVPVGINYLLAASQKDYLSVSESIELSNDKKYRELRVNIQMMPIKAGQKMILNNLFFDRAEYAIKETSYEELQRIIALMKEYPTMEVLLEGHTDNQGDLMKNVELAKNRVEEVRNYLVKNGQIDVKRIDVKSWGPIRPIASNTTEDTRKKNRRVEFTIVKM